jgi:hypothetical protein
MASEKKAQLEQELKQVRYITNFQQTYITFVDTLVDIYSEFPELNTWKNEVHSMTTQQFGQIAKEWQSELETNRKDILDKQPNLFLKNVPCLHKIHVPQLWIAEKFTENSKKYVWDYLKVLLEQASNYVGNTPSPMKDIQPPNISNIQDSLPAGIGELYNQLPKSMLEKVRGVADKYSNQVESGETNLEDLNFSEISKSLIDSINAEEMQQVVQSIGGMLQGVMAGVNPDDFKQFLHKQ